jgi:hypothetical protein
MNEVHSAKQNVATSIPVTVQTKFPSTPHSSPQQGSRETEPGVDTNPIMNPNKVVVPAPDREPSIQFLPISTVPIYQPTH